MATQNPSYAHNNRHHQPEFPDEFADLFYWLYDSLLSILVLPSFRPYFTPVWRGFRIVTSTLLLLIGGLLLLGLDLALLAYAKQLMGPMGIRWSWSR